MARANNWCFTINNYSDDDFNIIPTWDARYTIYGKEVGDSGTPHLQGFVIMNKVCRLPAMKKLHATAHWEQAKGSWEQNKKYCSKGGDFTELGTAPTTKRQRGDDEKNRWEANKLLAKQGKLDELDADIFWRFYKTAKEIAKDNMVKPADADDVTGIWIYGPPGTGKSRQARANYPGAYDKMQNKWWDGYQGEDYVILDDFDSKELGHHLKIWADRYSFLAETKGGAINIRPKKIIITSNYSPDHFEWDDEMKAAIKRRFKVIHLLGTLGGVPTISNPLGFA